MAEDDNNLVLRLLREVRSDTQDIRQRMTRAERHLEELREGMVQSAGLASLAAVTTEKQGEGMDKIRDEIAAPKRRVAELETRK